MARGEARPRANQHWPGNPLQGIGSEGLAPAQRIPIYADRRRPGMIAATIKQVCTILTLLDRKFRRDRRKNWALLKLKTTCSGERLKAELEFAATTTMEATARHVM